MGPKLLIDVDAIAKLSHWGMLEMLPQILNTPWSQAATLSSLRFRASKSINQPDGKLFLSAAAAQMASDVSKKMAQLGAGYPDELAAFSAVASIDAGEALLMSYAVHLPQSVLLTGDKRSLRAVASLPEATPLIGRIVILEQVVSACLKIKGRDWVLERICPMRHIDKSISLAMGYECNAAESAIAGGLHSYINEISTLTSPPMLANIDCL